MAGARKPAGDFTGRQVEKQQQELVEELEKRQSEIATAQRLQKQHDDSIILDYSDPDHVKEIPVASAPAVSQFDEFGQVVESEFVDAVDPETVMVEVRPLESIEFTKGYGNNYSLKAGQRSRVPKHVADHLEEKGLIA